MTSIEHKLLEKYQPVTLNENDIGKEFIIVSNNTIYVGKLIDIVHDNAYDHANIKLKNGVTRLINMKKYKAFRISDIKENHNITLLKNIKKESYL